MTPPTTRPDDPEFLARAHQFRARLLESVTVVRENTKDENDCLTVALALDDLYRELFSIESTIDLPVETDLTLADIATELHQRLTQIHSAVTTQQQKS